MSDMRKTLLILLFSLTSHAYGQTPAENDSSAARAKKANGLPLIPARSLACTATEGSWMSLDVSPDGRQLVFELLGDLYTLPVEISVPKDRPEGTVLLRGGRIITKRGDEAYGVTTQRDPQTSSEDVITFSDLVETGEIMGPRIYSTGPGVFSSDGIASLEEARNVLRRYGDHYNTFTIKQYLTGDRQVRRWVIMAADELGPTPTTEGGSSFHHENGLDGDIGSLEPGKLADLIVLDRNPLDDITNTESVSLVMKNGRLYESATLNEIWPRQRELPEQWWWRVEPTP